MPFLAFLLLLLSSLPALAAEPGDSALQADRVVVEKARHRMTLYRRGAPLRRYGIALGSGGLGPKRQRDDKRTPEGLYFVDGRNPHSGYHLALHISYPNAGDRAAAAANGVDPGGDIMIHGIRNGFGWLGGRHRASDWTAGCIATTDSQIEEIWRMVPDGTPVEIRP